MFDPREEEFVRAGILDPLIRDGELGEEEGEWEWKEKHSLFR